MNRHVDPATLHVVRTADNEVEVFSSADDAREFARHKRGATVLERTIRSSLRDAQIVYERRVQVTKGVVTHDATNDEPFFAVGADSWIRTAEVESFEGKDDDWTIVGLGTEHQKLDALVDREISRVVSSA